MKFDIKNIDKMTLFWLMGIIPETMMLCGVLYAQYAYTIVGLVIAMFLSRDQSKLVISGQYTLRKGISGVWIMLLGSFIMCGIIIAIFGMPVMLTK